MIVHDVVQGSDQWLQLRMGLPTASSFDKIVTPGGKLSAASESYMRELLAERLIGRAIQGPTLAVMQRGRELESSAVEFYEFTRETQTQLIGLVTTDDMRYGASPDRLVGEDGLLEIKCPTPAVHVGYLVNQSVDKAYYPQIQGQLLVTGRKWVDIVSYHPEMPMCCIRVTRDEEYIKVLTEALDEFCKAYAKQIEALKKQGYLQ